MEVEIAGGSARGWIDLLAYRPADGLLLVIEVKTELVDIGLVQRQLAWYERSAWRVARGLGWRPRSAMPLLLVLASERNVEGIGVNRILLADHFAATVREVADLVAGRQLATSPRRGMALIDPYELTAGRSRRGTPTTLRS